MKKIRKYVLLVFLALAGFASAQEVMTLYFLENAPMRHIVNPAFQPVSNGYINFTPLGYMSFWAGNNSLTMSDVVYTKDGKTITPLYPGEDKAAFIKQWRKSTLVNADITFDLVSFGFRVKENGYFHFNVLERINLGTTVPRTLPEFIFGGGMSKQGLNDVNKFSLGGLGIGFQMYTEVGFGYSHKINEQWTVGGKLKLLLGTAYAGLDAKDLGIDGSLQKWDIHGNANLQIAGPINRDQLPNDLKDLKNIDFNKLIDYNNIKKMITPSGYGAAVDLGFTYKPHEQVQITAAINDLGFIYWNNGSKYTASIDTTFTGVGEVKYGQYLDDKNNFLPDSLKNDIIRSLQGLLDAAHLSNRKDGFARMVNAKLNVGVDANFWDNRIGIGVLSQTRLYNSKIYEEVTLGAALRPCNWFNLAVSYSLLQNGKYSNIGAGLSFMPYDGINMTLAMDYIPTSYAKLPIGDKDIYALPYKAKGVNVALGFSIVWGTNKKKDKDKDGVLDQFDMCPNTPKNVKVDDLGCPIDSDGDGVPDYLDQCPGTHPSAYGLVDSVGCPIDSDGDGVPDYLDECPGTPEAAYGMVDEKGCAIDSDGDGVPDYLDECPGSPAEAAGHVDEKGCELDTDGDGVPDWKDQCPNTPAEAIGYTDSIGCELDTDGDGVPDWRDECPGTPAEAIGFVDEKGCELDTDGDGVPDWKDQCPAVAGPAYNKGCPEVKKEVRNLLNKAMQGIQFETGKAVIKKASYPLMDQIAKTFIDNPNFIIEVQGHTDDVGAEDFNKELSDKRAHSVMDYLIKAGVPAERMTAKGYGMDVPIADNRTKSGRAKNRRVEFKITFEEVHIETVLEHIDSTLYKQHLDSIQPQAVKLDTVAKQDFVQTNDSIKLK